MGVASPEEVLNGVPEASRKPVVGFLDALPVAREAYLATFDADYGKRQAEWRRRRLRRACVPSTPWLEGDPSQVLEEE
jgi:hypothetical protein